MSTTTPPRRRLARRAAPAVLLALALSGLAAPAAHAHDQLIASDPSPGAQLVEPPARVELTFVSEVMPMGGAIHVVDGAERMWTDGEDVTYDGSRVRIDVRDDMPDGAYEIRWRVVSGDGHPISGIIPFTVGETTPEPSTPNAPSGDVGGAGAGDSSAHAGDADRSGGSGTAAESGGQGGAGDVTAAPGSLEQSAPGARTVLVGLVGAVIAAAAYAIGLAVRRRGRATPASAPEAPTTN